MFDLANCYLVVFTDQAGTVHCVPFAKDDGGNSRANDLLKTLRAVGLRAGKYLPDKQNFT
jgi:hypothetical protein